MLKKNLANFYGIKELFTQKIVTKLSKIWFWDPRSGIRIKPIADPRSRGQKGTGSATLLFRQAGISPGSFIRGPWIPD
jgi:hypothetical protein